MRDAFISYGRAESKAFATKLHDRLRSEGLNVWFDQNDIPLGVDFQNQIDDGIEKAHNFLFIIAPHALKSQYCLKEVLLAIKYSKRIIPILHVEPNSKEIWDKMHPTISKLNWVYMRQREDKAIPQVDWENIDDFEKSFKGLLGLIQRHKDYVQKHTEILIKALEWERRQKDSEYLVSGYERIQAENWLHTEFKSEQSPCFPSPIHAEFICESRKFAYQGQSDIFIANAGEENDIRQRVVRILETRGYTTWQHEKDIKLGQNFEEATKEGIENADNFMFPITQDTITNETYLKELHYAFALNKRIIPLLLDPVETSVLPEDLKRKRIVDFTDNETDEDFNRDIAEILNIINKDKDFFLKQKRLLSLALQWERLNKSHAILMREHHLADAKVWLETAQNSKRNKSLPIIEHYINASDDAIGKHLPELFIAYSRVDEDFVRRLNAELQRNGRDTWCEQEFLGTNLNFSAEINKGIEDAQNFLFIFSPQSIASPDCIRQIEYAAKMNKRLICLKIQSISTTNEIPKLLTSTQFIDFEKNRFDVAFGEVLRTLDTDREHIRTHVLYSQKAIYWEQKGRTQDLLLRGAELKNAKWWLKDTLDNKKEPAPTDLQIAYIKESRNYAAFLLRRIVYITLTFAAMASLGLYAAYQQRKAVAALEIAEQNKALAQKNEKIAVEQSKEAQIQRLKAEKNAKEANNQRAYAEFQRKNAELNANNAYKQRLEAEEQKRIAEMERQKAEREKNKAILHKKEAEINAKLAKNKQKDAEEKKKQADSLVLVSDTLRYVSQMLSYAVKSKSMQLQEDDYRKIDFANSAFLLRQKYNAPQSDADVYDALFDAVKTLDGEEGYTHKLHQGEIRSMHIDVTGHFLLTVGGDGKLIFFDLKSNTIHHQESFGNEFIRSVNISSDKKYVALSTESGKIIIYDFDLKRVAHSFQTHHKIWALRFVPNSHTVIYTGSSGKVSAYNIQTHKHFVIFSHTTPIRSITLLPDGKKLFAGSEDAKVLVCDIIEHAKPQILPIKIEKSFVTSLACSFSGNIISVGTSNGIIFLWDYDHKKLIAKLFGHKARISASKFSENGEFFASASFDGSVRLRKTSDWEIDPIILDPHAGMVMALAFSKDKKTLYAGYADGTLRIYPTSIDFLHKKMCESYIRLGRRCEY